MTAFWTYFPAALLCAAASVASHVSIRFDRWLIAPKTDGRQPRRGWNAALAVVRLDIFSNWLSVAFFGALTVVLLFGMFGAFDAQN